jgi:hypothetical protein
MMKLTTLLKEMNLTTLHNHLSKEFIGKVMYLQIEHITVIVTDVEIQDGEPPLAVFKVEEYDADVDTTMAAPTSNEVKRQIEDYYSTKMRLEFTDR